MVTGCHRRSPEKATAMMGVEASIVMSASALDSNVLVLNRFYSAIRVISVRRALTLLYRECAEVITLEADRYFSYEFASWCELSQLQSEDKQPGEEYIRAVGFELQVPRIVRLTKYDRLNHPAVRFNRRNLFARDNYCCQYCGQTKPTSMLSIDHVLPRSMGGKTSWENVVCSCLRCNSRKGGRTPQQARMALLTEPARPAINPALTQPISDPRYECWKTFLPHAS
jgi:5-methylcytosine-specific restriction endonuclease McrA